MRAPLDTRAWVHEQSERAELEVTPIALAESEEWSWMRGAIEHRSGRFFRVVGYEHESGVGPLIEQPEIGTLCSIVRRAEAPQVLVQAKAEPGTVGVVQLAPSIQATASNADRVHGGEAPPLQTAARAGAIETLSRVVASEQGTRFLGKTNANVLARVVAPLPPSAAHRWIAVDELLELAGHDYTVNTDLRSVLISSPWRALIDRRPFRRRDDELSRWLAMSLESTGAADDARERVQRAAARVRPGRTVPLDVLGEYRRTDEGIEPVGGLGFRVRQIHVRVAGREVPVWDQPIVDSMAAGSVELWMRVDRRYPQFGFRLAAEPGLLNRVELTATVVASPGTKLPATESGLVLARVNQSDEGGRFFHDTSEYRLVLADDPDAAAADTTAADDVGAVGDELIWLGLGDVEQLLAEGRWLTNEARSALALVLPWM